MRRDSQGMRDLQQFLEGLRTTDDATFAEATDGANRAESMLLLDRLNKLLSDLDRLTTEIQTGEKPAPGAPRAPE